MRVRASRAAALAVAAAGACLLLWLRGWSPCPAAPPAAAAAAPGAAARVPGREMPLIFIGGVPRSGTTLMRAMLDSHPDVRCGQETRVVPRILQMRQHWYKSQKESVRLEEAGITSEVLDNAIASFCLEVIVRHGESAPRLCNKDPLMLKMGAYVIQLFPNAKFLFMVRDGRATVHSIISRQVTISGFDLTSYRQCLTKWNQAIEMMYNQCKSIGPDKCLMVHYEQLVLHPRQQLERVLGFLQVPWDEAVLHHEQFINKPHGVLLSLVHYEQLVLHPRQQLERVLGFLQVPWDESVLHHEQFINKPHGVLLSKVERSSDQVIKPVNLEALSKWVGQVPGDVLADMAELAPMLSVLGYDPWANPPTYGAADAAVANNTRRLAEPEQRALWRERARRVLRKT